MPRLKLCYLRHRTLYSKTSQQRSLLSYHLICRVQQLQLVQQLLLMLPQLMQTLVSHQVKREMKKNSLRTTKTLSDVQRQNLSPLLLILSNVLTIMIDFSAFSFSLLSYFSIVNYNLATPLNIDTPREDYYSRYVTEAPIE